MLITALFLVWDNFIRAVLSFLPRVDLSDLPIAGPTIQETLLEVIITWNAVMVTVPYLQVVWYVFLFGVMPFELGLLLLKVFLGNRTPQAIN